MSFDFLSPIPLSPASPRLYQPGRRVHGTPSGPWPFLEIHDEVEESQLAAPQPRQQDEEQAHDWPGYPQSLFPNWTFFQQKKSGIAKLIRRQGPLSKPSSVYTLDIRTDGTFHSTEGSQSVAQDAGKVEFWTSLQEKPSPDVRIRALFVDNLNGPVLQMLGTKFDIEPFFFSSSLSGIPGRYQSLNQPGIGDHITITLSFARTLSSSGTVASSPNPSVASDLEKYNTRALQLANQVIDTQGPLRLHSTNHIILLDLLSLHVIRRVVPSYAADLPTSPTSPKTPPLNKSFSQESATRREGISTIISYHQPSSSSYRTTTAKKLHERVLAAGQSVYWSKIFSSTVPSGDPTFVLLSMLWYPMYAWDEALEALVSEVAWLEYRTLATLPKSTDEDEEAHNNTQRLTHQLHVVRAHLLHYEGLLDDFRKTVEFVLDTPHPGLRTSTPPPKSASDFSLSSPSLFARRRYSRSPSSSSPVYFSTPRMPSIQQTKSNGSTSLPREYDVHLDGTPYDSDEESTIQDQMKDRELKDKLSHSDSHLRKEANQLLNEIKRLEMTRRTLDKRLGNVMALAFSNVNIEDSKRMARMTEAALKDSAATKQIAYLTTFFLPATFIATIFGMNVIEIVGIPDDGPPVKGTLGHYFAAAIPLTVVTFFFIMWQYRYLLHKTGARSHTDIGLPAATFEYPESAGGYKKRWWWLTPFSTRKETITRRRRSIILDGPVQ